MITALPFGATAQAPATSTTPAQGAAAPSVAPTVPVATTTTSANPSVQVGGTTAVDIINLKAGGPGTPLRFGNVVQGSERVQLNGRLLTAVDDYAIDYASGVVYLKIAQKTGDTMTVSYRYDSTGKLAGSASAFSALNSFQYSVMPGGLSMLGGLGMTERASDGTILRSNIFGWKDSVGNSTSGSGLSGLFLYGDRQKSTNGSGLNLNPDAKPGDASKEEGKSQFLVQNFRSNLMGGSMTLDYQDISQNFVNFGSVSSSGYAESDVKKFQAEKGLQRTGLGFTGVKVGGLALSNGMREVKDSTGSISWRNYGIDSGAFKLNYTGQKVDNTFNRFKDISEADRDQLARERGMSRQNFVGSFAQKLGTLGFNSSSIVDDETHKKIDRSEYTFKNNGFNVDYGEQSVAEGFARATSLAAPEQAMYSREAGMRRTWLSLNTIVGKDQPFKFSDSSFKNAVGDFASRDVAYTGKTWNITHVERSVSKGFTSLGALQDAEQDANVKTIAGMYSADIKTNPGERAGFLTSTGLSRDFTQLNTQLFKGLNASFSTLKLKGVEDSGKVDTLALNGARFNVSYRSQDLGSKFNELSNMIDFEKQHLGSVLGLKRTDFAFNTDMGANRKLSMSQMKANTAAGGAERTSLAYSAKGIEISANSRSVATGFTNVSQMADSEASLLDSFRGFKESDVKAKWDVNKSFHFETTLQDASDADTKESRHFSNTLMNWAPDKNTQVGFVSTQQHNDNPMALLFDNSLQRFSLTRNMGRYGKVELMDERIEYSGSTATLPSSHKQFFAFETKLNERTSLRTEQTRTDFGNGTKEDISTNTISTTLTKNAGVSISDVKIDRGTEATDETKRNYGLWYLFSNGLKFSYGYARDLQGTADGTGTSMVSLSQGTNPATPDQVGKVQQGQVGDLMLGGAYGTNTWDKTDRTQSFSNVAISTAKPFKVGPFQQLKVNFGLDTAADYANWVKENRAMGISGKVGAHQFGFDYKGQMSPDGSRAIDRAFKFQTDPSPKNWLTGSMAYKVRTLPWNQEVMIRDFSITARPSKTLSITNQLQTNPEVAKSDALLGSVPQAARSNKWKLDYLSNPNFTLGGSWEELINESSNAKSTTAGLNLKLFEKLGSPLTLFFGEEDVLGNVPHKTTYRYHLQFDQHPGPNQTLSFFFGNIAFQHSVQDGYRWNNYSTRLDYQLRF